MLEKTLDGSILSYHPAFLAARGSYEGPTVCKCP